MTDEMITTPDRRRKPKLPCSVEGCSKTAASNAMCSMHSTRMKRHGSLIPSLDYGLPIDRFHRKYAFNPDTGCWEWVCYRHPKGYGIFAIGAKRKVRAHRWSYEHFVGPIPSGLRVLHDCDNRRCVNWEHLFVGTDKDNMQDMARKGRAAGTVGSNKRRLTDRQVLNMRLMYARGEAGLTHLAWLYGYDDETVRKILKGQSHPTGTAPLP